MEDSNLTIIVIACIIAGLSLISLFLAVLVKWPRVKPTEVMALQGFGDICDVKTPGIRIIWPWQKAFYFPTIQVSVNIPPIEESAWKQDDEGNRDMIGMRVGEASVDLKVPKNLTVEGAKAFFEVRGALFTVVEEVLDKKGNLKGLIAQAGEKLKDEVGAAVRRYWADPNRPYDLIRTDKGGLARSILTGLKGAHQDECAKEKKKHEENIFEEACQQIRQELDLWWKQENRNRPKPLPEHYQYDADYVAAKAAYDEWLAQLETDYEDKDQTAKDELRKLILISAGQDEDQNEKSEENWGVEFIGVTIKNIRAADDEMENALQEPARASFRREADLIDARARVAIAEQGVLEAEQHAHAQACTLAIRGQAMATALGLRTDDGSLADWMIRQDGIQAVRDGWSSGGGVVVADGLLSRLMGGRAS